VLALLGPACDDDPSPPPRTPDAAAPDAAPDAAAPDVADAAVPDLSAAEAGAPDLHIVSEDPSDQPLRGLAGDQLTRFVRGDELFGTAFRLPDGLGPLYIRTSCAACHVEGGRGPGAVQKFAVIDAITKVPLLDAPEMAYGGTERPYAVAGASRPLLAPAMVDARHQLIQSRRSGPTVMGRGYVEAVLDSEIERVAAEQALRSDGIRGRINRVTYHSQAVAGVALPHGFGDKNLIGRFGLKARVATLDDFAADAFQGDMGLTSPMRPDELVNPEGVRDDQKPGPDMTAEIVTTVAAYVRTIAIPTRQGDSVDGRRLFAETTCSACHVPSLKTRADYPVALLADIDAPIYSDLLLHDMGDELADFILDETAGPREWKTPPLIALRFQRAFLHDGRARTIEEAILKHAGPGSQANGAVEKFKALAPTDKQALVTFVQGL
jgi:CxxC motif-containing protein (DUF1111 family)